MNQSVIKALQLLKLFDEKQTEWTLKEIAETAKLPKATAYRLLSSLEQEDFLARDPEPNGKYRLGLRLLELGNLVADQLDIRKIAKPYMEELGEEINEAVHLVIQNDFHATYIEKVESNRAIRLYTQVGKSSPLYIGSGPKLLLAFMNEAEQDRIFMQEPLRSIKNDEPIDQEKLQQELALIKKQGFSISYGEQDEDTVGISYPIYNHHGKVISALTVSGLSQHFEGERFKEIKRKTQHTATQISIALGAPKK
uniref:IclR family transcriptional regulator n=1 Tax=uncultured Allobacillus sp. TaxID=1638025 RepID=UPI00259739F7|nr:IclR family transcriptional regulator [uncultured Allobacillus sp.]